MGVWRDILKTIASMAPVLRQALTFNNIFHGYLMRGLDKYSGNWNLPMSLWVMYLYIRGRSQRTSAIFPLFLIQYPPHVCNCPQFKDPSLKRTSANREFDPPPLNFQFLKISKIQPCHGKTRKVGTTRWSLLSRGNGATLYDIIFFLKAQMVNIFEFW